MSPKIVERNMVLDARNDIDKNWLLRKDVDGDFLSDYVRNCQILVIRQTERICPRSYIGNNL